MIMNNHNTVELERALLGLLIVERQSIGNVINYLEPIDFFDMNNRIVYEAIIDISNNDMDVEVATLVASLKKVGKLEKIGGINFISSLVNEAGLSANLSKFVKEISEKSQLRKVDGVLSNLSSEIKKSDVSAEEILEKVEQEILSTTRAVQTSDFEYSSDIVDQAIISIRDKASHDGISGLPSEYPSLDDMTSGFQKGDLIILAARPSMGKTAFALNLAANVSRDATVAIFSLEMPAIQLMNRIISFTGFIEGDKIREPNKMNDSDWTKFHQGSDQVKEMNIYVDDSAGLRLAELVWKAKKLHKNKGLDMIVIDYLQLLTVGPASSRDRQAEVSVISRTLKKLARELDIPIIALSQLSRAVENRENKTPIMADIRESGSIEQDADIIMFLFRGAYYEEDKGIGQVQQDTKIIIAKHRNGAIGNVYLKFNPRIGLFTDTKVAK